MCFGHCGHCHGDQKPFHQSRLANPKHTSSRWSNCRILPAFPILNHTLVQKHNLCPASMAPRDHLWCLEVVEILVVSLYEDPTIHSLQLVTLLLHSLLNKSEHIILHIINLFQQVAILKAVVYLPGNSKIIILVENAPDQDAPCINLQSDQLCQIKVHEYGYLVYIHFNIHNVSLAFWFHLHFSWLLIWAFFSGSGITSWPLHISQ